jgi:hypothetical protein
MEQIEANKRVALSGFCWNKKQIEQCCELWPTQKTCLKLIVPNK